MRFSQVAGLTLAFASLSGAHAAAQSLGDVARQQREQQAKTASPTSNSKKVITNEDLPEHSDATTPASEDAGNYPPASNDVHSAGLWKAAILRQKNLITSMQKSVEQLKSSVHFVEANRYEDGVQYNQRQLRKLQYVDQQQKRLDEQKKRLDAMQEAARRAGLGSAVYDP